MFFILLLILLTVIVWNSKLEIRIENLDISTDRKEKIKNDYEIYLRVIIFNKIPIFKISIKKMKTQKINLKAILEQIKNFEKKQEKVLPIKELIENFKNLEVEIKKTNLKIGLGTKDAAQTAIFLGILSGFLGIILKKQKFEILPIYQDKNILKIKLNCIIRINLIHYIYKTISKRRDKNERKSSHRRAYAYSNE